MNSLSALMECAVCRVKNDKVCLPCGHSMCIVCEDQATNCTQCKVPQKSQLNIFVPNEDLNNLKNIIVQFNKFSNHQIASSMKTYDRCEQHPYMHKSYKCGDCDSSSLLCLICFSVAHVGHTLLSDVSGSDEGSHKSRQQQNQKQKPTRPSTDSKKRERLYLSSEEEDDEESVGARPAKSARTVISNSSKSVTHTAATKPTPKTHITTVNTSSNSSKINSNSSMANKSSNKGSGNVGSNNRAKTLSRSNSAKTKDCFMECILAVRAFYDEKKHFQLPEDLELKINGDAINLKQWLRNQRSNYSYLTGDDNFRKDALDLLQQDCGLWSQSRRGSSK